ncbi:site-specific integrase [Dyadobacter sp. 22481]|uniref:site-specific integrase n=1 Tax=Dyadobacter sp. 22481 TaxID=3453926 RepID=UPI003F83B31D
MLSRNLTTLFYLKKRSGYVKGVLPIYLRITVNGERFEISTKRECEPEKWNSVSGRKNGTREDARMLNSYLDSMQLKVYDIQKQMLENNNELTAEKLRNRINGVSDKSKDILEIFQDHNDKLALMVGSDYALGTLGRYKTSYDHTKAFIEWKYKTSEFDINQLNYEFISEYAFWLKSEKCLGHNTAMKYLTNFKKIVIICVKKGWLMRDPFSNFQISLREVNREALTPVELQNISNKDFENQRLEHVRDIFIFCCYTGLAYADVFKLKRSEIIDGVDGEKWLSIKRQKTDTPSRIPILPMAQIVLDKYASSPECVTKDKLLPVLSNQKMNSYLKEIGDVCRINKVITFHLARHTFATTITLTNGVPIESVSKMLGHRNIKTTQHYAKIVDKKISDDMARLRKVLITQ